MLRNFSSYYIGSKPTNQISHAILPNDSHGKNIPRRFFWETRDRDGGYVSRRPPSMGFLPPISRYFIFLYIKLAVYIYFSVDSKRIDRHNLINCAFNLFLVLLFGERVRRMSDPCQISTAIVAVCHVKDKPFTKLCERIVWIINGAQRVVARHSVHPFHLM